MSAPPPPPQPSLPSAADSMRYGAVRHAFLYGSALTAEQQEEHRRQMAAASADTDGDVAMNSAPAAAAAPATDSDTFWSVVGVPESVAPPAAALLAQAVRESRASMRERCAEAKACPERLRLEQQLVERWQRMAAEEMGGATGAGAGTPLPTVEPLDPLQSPFAHF